ncbi:hypothetical protein [Actinomycetospora succinea]|uniref:hypothetical protein n=1 Tax=Actinomycetospora succinea TaxID=663603 RepID=UPI00105E3005|nr:hypothetical protein [Actinomycetospora succinea]
MAATATVYDGDRRLGSAVLVDRRRLLTARHVLPETARGLAVSFPDTAPTVRLPVRTVPPEVEDGTSPDVAVLELEAGGGEDHDTVELPVPVPVRSARRPPDTVEVFGFPTADRSVAGVFRTFPVAGRTAGGTIQVDWSHQGTMPGHSGAPVLDAATGELTGIVVEGAPQGGFDRYLPVGAAHRLWPSLPRPWVVHGPEGRGHFLRRAEGQHSVDRGGDRFRGRRLALDRVTDWMRRDEPPGLPLVVTGQPGAGKSAVLSRAAFHEATDVAALGLAVHARGLTHREFLDRLAELVGTRHPTPARDLVVTDVERAREPVLIAVDALDEAATADDRVNLAQTLAELARLPHVRVCVASRPLAAADRFAAGTLLRRLGMRSAEAPNLVDLDADAWADGDGLVQFAAAVLEQAGARHPGPPGCAWEHYRAHPAVRDRLASVIARQAHGNYLVTSLAAAALSDAEDPLDPADPGFDQSAVPTDVEDFVERFLHPGGDAPDGHREALLSALAYAYGDGLDDDTWLRFVAALGHHADRDDLARLRTSSAADYLLQSVPASGGGARTRVFHQALVDALLGRRLDPVADQRRLVRALLDAVAAAGGWEHADAYARRHAADHAAGAESLDELLDDGDFVAVADFVRLLPLLNGESRHSGAVRRVIVRAGSLGGRLAPGPRRQLLALGAAHLGRPDLAERHLGDGGSGVRPLWAHHLGQPHQQLDGHRSAVRAVALGRVDGRGVVVSGGGETVRLWDPSTGEPTRSPLNARRGRVRAVVVRLARDRVEIVSGGADGTVRRWDARTGAPVGRPTVCWPGPVRAMALGTLDGREVAVGLDDRGVALRDVSSGEVLAQPAGIDPAVVRSFAIGRIGSKDVVVVGTSDARLHLWDPAEPGAPDDVASGHARSVTAVGVGRLDGRDVVVTGGGDSLVVAWDVTTRELVREPFTGHVRAVRSVAIGVIDGRNVIVSGGEDTAVRVWDPSADALTGRPLDGHHGWVRSLAVGRAGGEDVLVSGSDDRRVGVWDPATGRARRFLTGHTSPVRGVALAGTEDQEVVASVSDDHTLRLTALDGTPQVAAPVSRLHSWARGVAVGTVGGTETVVVAEVDRVRVLRGGQEEQRAWPGLRAVALGSFEGRDVLVAGGDDGLVLVCDALSGDQLVTFADHDDAVGAVALGRLGGHDVVASGSRDGTVRVGSGADGRDREVLRHGDRVRAVSTGTLGGRDVVVTCCEDHLVRLWDPVAGLVTAVAVHTPATAAVVAGHTLYVATGRALCALTVDADGSHWRPPR